jgi:DNA repair protein RadA/Sms
MAKSKIIYVCQECGFESPRWVGKCSGCGSWNTLVEEQTAPIRHEPLSGVVLDEKPVLLKDVEAIDRQRISLGIRELDRV